MIRPKYGPGDDSIAPAGRQFTDRVDYITAFRRALEAPRPPHRVLVFYGVGGIGKTTLRKELARRFAAEHPGGLWCTVDFVIPQLRGPEAALAAIAYNLTHDPDGAFRRNGLTFPAFELAYLTYLQKVEPHKPIKEYRNVPLFDPDSVLAQVVGATLDWASDAVSVVKVINRMRDLIRDHVTRRQYAAIQELPGLEPSEILERLPYFLAADLKNWMQRHPGRPVVICLDSYAALWQRRTDGLEFETDGWVRELIAHLPVVLWVICGREKLRWHERYPEWEPALDQHLVGRMADQDMEVFLTSCGIADPAVRARIIQASEGVPFYLDLAVDTYYEIKRTKEPAPDDFTPARGEVMDRFLRYLSEPETVTLRVLCVARWWDRSLFEHLVREFQTGYPLRRSIRWCGSRSSGRRPVGGTPCTSSCGPTWPPPRTRNSCSGFTAPSPTTTPPWPVIRRTGCGRRRSTTGCAATRRPGSPASRRRASTWPGWALPTGCAALIHALRFNRFALDEALGTAAGPMARHGLIPFLRAQGGPGRDALRALADWWREGRNALPEEPALNISPVGAGSPLVAAERLAREREPGDGSRQLTVLEQLAAALGEQARSKYARSSPRASA